MTSETMNRRDVLGAAAVVAAAAVASSDGAAAQPAGGRMTVHVLDLFSGTPANGVKIDLFTKKADEQKLVKSVTTGVSGRPDSGPLLAGETFAPGRYVIAFDLSDYFKGADKSLPARYFRKISMEFEVTDASMAHHIPLQCTAWTQACSVLPG